MNKRFYTLMAGIMLAGSAFSTASATEVTSAQFEGALKEIKTLEGYNDKATGKYLDLDALKDALKKEGKTFDDATIELTGDVDLTSKGGYVLIDKAVTLTAAKKQTPTLTGRIVVAADGVEISNLKITNKPVNAEAHGYWTKNAITVFAKKTTITDNTITGVSVAATENPKAPALIPNSVVIFPQGTGVEYKVKGNTFTSSTTANDDFAASAVSVAQNVKMPSADLKPNDPLLKSSLAGYGKNGTSVVTDGIDKYTFADNTFSKSDADILVSVALKGDKTEYSIVQVTAAGEFGVLSDKNKEVLTEAITNSNKDGESVVNVLGSTTDAVLEVIKDVTDAQDVNLAINIADAKGDAQQAIVLGEVTNAPEGALIVTVGANGSFEGAWVTTPLDEIKDGKVVLLMTADGKVLKGQKDGKAESVSYQGDLRGDDLKPIQWTVKYNEAEKKYTFKNVATGEYLKDTNSQLVVVAEDVLDSFQYDSKSIAFGETFYQTTAIEVGNLIKIYGTSFPVTIEYADAKTDAEKVLANNPFADQVLTPVRWANEATMYQGETVELKNYSPYGDNELLRNQFMLQNAEGKLIVMKKELYATGNSKNYAYKLVAEDAKTVAASLKKEEDLYVTLFSFNGEYGQDISDGGDIRTITVTQDTKTSYQLGSIVLNKKNTLAAADPSNAYLDAIKISLKGYNTIDPLGLLNGKFYTMVNKNTKSKYSDNYGKVLGLNHYGNEDFCKTSEVVMNHPETQWAVTSNGSTYTFANRENPRASFTVPASAFYKTAKDNVYAFRGTTTNVPFVENDTIEIKAVEKHDAADGYKRYNDINTLKDQLFHIGSYSGVRETAYITENHKDNHQVGLDTDIDNATAWRLVPLMYQEEDVWGVAIEGTMTPDTICVISQLGIIKDKKPAIQADTLKIVAYSFRNSENGEFMAFDNSRDRFTTGYETNNKDGFATADQAQYFTLKEMGDDKYNLVEIPVDYYEDGRWFSGFKRNEDGEYYVIGGKDKDGNRVPYTLFAAADADKVYAGETGSKGILNHYDMYEQNESDLFTIEEKDAPEYLKLAQGDHVKLFRAEYDSESNVLYEKGEFLGIGNAVESKNINPVIYVDSAAHHGNRWEYLLAVRVDSVMHEDGCGVPEHGTVATNKIDTLKGDFLVNFVDSAIVAEGKDDVHVNKYMYSDGNGDWAKLGFVNGYHTGDNLFITENEDKINVGSADPQLVKFAFRVVDNDTKTFVIETAYKAIDEDAEIEKYGYLRYDNGVVYVTNEIENAEIFKLTEDSRDAVANDEISVSGISVGTTNGAVIVKGAAGKKVTISNVLGQTIANTVIASDEAIIATPAGVVVVAVDGEAAVKAIVK